MCEYLKLKIETWKLKILCEASGIWKLKIEIFEFGPMNIESWKLKGKIWNFFVKCLEGIWNFENWKLKCLNTKNWKKCLKIENWNV
jgi:hypothetical protein